jgi:hypothetical protein
MASNWVNIKLEGVIPQAVKQLANTIDTIVSALKTGLNIQVAALKLISALTTDALNAEALTIKAAVSTIEAALKPLLNDAQLHLLIVPFRKQPNYRLDPENWPVTLMDSDDGPFENNALAKEEQEIREKLRQVAFYNGGNQGYLRTVAEALRDEGDTNRPEYDENSAIYAHIWVAGASDIVGILDALLTLEGLFGISLKSNNFVPRTLIRTPQDLTVKPINAPSGKIGAVLRWSNPPAEQVFPEFNDIRIRLHEVAIIRSTDDEVIKAKNWTDLFGDTQPDVLEDGDEDETDVLESDNEKSEVILQFRHDGTRSSYLDDSDLQRDTDYYYAVAYRYAVKLPPGISVSDTATVVDGFSVMDYKLLSNVQNLRFAEVIPESTGGVKPDWVATPGVLSLIPDLQFYAVVLREYLNAMANQALGGNAALQSYINFLEDEIERYEELAETITARIQRLTGLLKTPEAGIYTTSIELESGGSDEFIRELARRILDDTDTSAPPFHTGTEFVAGIVLLAGAPNFAELTTVKTLIELLFGTSGSIKTPYEEAVDSLDQVVADQAAEIFGDDLQPTTEEPTTTTAQKTFNDAMEPVDASDPDANVPGVSSS